MSPVMIVGSIDPDWIRYELNVPNRGLLVATVKIAKKSRVVRKRVDTIFSKKERNFIEA